jgi:hypothetical protein
MNVQQENKRIKCPLRAKPTQNPLENQEPSYQTGFHPSWSSLCHLGICSGTNLRLRRLVPNFYGNLRLAGAQTVWLLHFMLQMYTTQQKTSILNNNHPTKNNTMVEPVAGLVARL